uniref:Uncharacterized protein n=1 Tax=Megaviridae environmental sample TaxID=1737588 RepID=A0A5J6VK91_9VIRU|nr:MAG: hypothetical protein [Megaviridae environmental sample]
MNTSLTTFEQLRQEWLSLTKEIISLEDTISKLKNKRDTIVKDLLNLNETNSLNTNIVKLEKKPVNDILSSESSESDLSLSSAESNSDIDTDSDSETE